MKYWKQLTKAEIRKRVFAALERNVDYRESKPLGIPGSYLDEKVFYHDAPFLKDAPFLTSLIYNPNHIGCHTLGESESFFSGTQELERELIAICANEILGGNQDAFDGYVASGGTEANMQAIRIYRNYFMAEHEASLDEICILCSADTHYSMSKAADVFSIQLATAAVDDHDRSLIADDVRRVVRLKKERGVKCFIVVANMMTTMFGSVDDPDAYAQVLEDDECTFVMHIDGAYGGFVYPFTNPANQLDFRNPMVTSVTLDAHKMVQAPYGTGIFLIRKGWMKYAVNRDATYVQGEDYTLVGSRSGANAIAVWMILMTYGRYGWHEKMAILMKRTDWLEEELHDMKVQFFRNPFSNIVTIRSQFITPAMAHKYGLVPDNHHAPEWYKIVVMDHVQIESMIPLLAEVRRLVEA